MELKKDASMVRWESLATMANVNEMVEYFTTQVNSLIMKHVPITHIKISTDKRHTFLPKSARKLMKKGSTKSQA